MTKEAYYEEERMYEAQQEALAELNEREDEDGEPYEDEWQAHGFRDAADFWRWKGF